MSRLWILALFVLLGCGAPDAARDVGTDAPTDAASAIGLPAAPAAPAIVPCPDGWRQTAIDGGGEVCDPWPAGGHVACGAGEAHFAGMPGCARIGPPCPPDGWPEALPMGRPIVWVDPSASGDGSARESALASLDAAVTLASATAGSIVALHTGRHVLAGEISLRDVELIGACASESVVAGMGIAPVALGDRGALRSLSIDGSSVLLRSTGASARITEVEITAPLLGGLYVFGGSIALERVVVRGFVLSPDTAGASGIVIDTGEVTMDQVLVEGAPESGVVIDAGAALDARDLAILGTGGDPDLVSGVSILARTGARVDLERLAIGGDDLAIAARGTTLSIRTADIGAARVGAVEGAALHAFGGASVTVERAHVHGRRRFGILLADPSVELLLRDVVLEAMEGDADGEDGIALVVGAGARATLERVLIARAREAAILTGGMGAVLDARDLEVRDTLPESSTDARGAALWAQDGAEVTITRTRLLRSSLAAIASVSGAHVVARDLDVSEVTAAPCAATTCPEESGGFGIVAHAGGSLDVESFAVTNAELCGLLVGPSTFTQTSLDARLGAIERSPVGACVQVADYDSSRLHDRVEFRDVGVPLQATSYRLPDAISPP